MKFFFLVKFSGVEMRNFSNNLFSCKIFFEWNGKSLANLQCYKKAKTGKIRIKCKKRPFSFSLVYFQLIILNFKFTFSYAGKDYHTRNCCTIESLPFQSHFPFKSNGPDLKPFTEFQRIVRLLEIWKRKAANHSNLHPEFSGVITFWFSSACKIFLCNE